MAKEATNKGPTMLKKLSAKTIMAEKPTFFLEKDAKEAELFAVAGLAVGTKSGETTFGAWTAFLGDFVAVNRHTGEEFRGGKLFIPEPTQSMLAASLAKAAGGQVQIALLIGVKKRPDLTIGYEYTVRPLIPDSAQDAARNLLHESMKSLPALPGPKGGK